MWKLFIQVSFIFLNATISTILVFMGDYWCLIFHFFRTSTKKNYRIETPIFTQLASETIKTASSLNWLTHFIDTVLRFLTIATCKGCNDHCKAILCTQQLLREEKEMRVAFVLEQETHTHLPFSYFSWRK